MHAALTIFALKGYAPASMDDICLASGMSKGGLYHHFSTKPAVLAAVVDRLALADALIPGALPVDDAQLPPRDAVGRLLIEIWAEASRDREMGAQLRAGSKHSVEPGSPVASGDALLDMLRIGALIQLLTRGDSAEQAIAALKLGLDQAA